MTQAIIAFVISGGVIIGAGIVLARAAERLAQLTGLGRLIVGSILLAAATSLPELSVDMNAVWNGHDDIAVGDLMGSSLANLLILAVADLIHRSGRGIFSRASAAHALSGAITIVLTGMASLAILMELDRGVAGIGAGSAIVFVVYVLGARMVYRNQSQIRSARNSANTTSSTLKRAPEHANRRKAMYQQIGLFCLAAIATLVASPFVANSAGSIAENSGLGESFVGTAFVALTTSLPEMVTVLAAVRMGVFDLAVGNVFGSNAFNMAMLLPIDIVSQGPLLARVSPVQAMSGIWIVIITAVAMAGQLYNVERRRRLIEPDALLVIGLVALALVTVYQMR